MSTDRLEDSYHHCDLQHQIRTANDVAKAKEVAAKIIAAQRGVACEEMGDVIAGPTEALLIAGLPPDDLAHKDLATAVADCLRDRYMGYCATAGECSGRRMVDNLLRQSLAFAPQPNDV